MRRKFLCHHQSFHLARLDVTILYCYYHVLSRPIPHLSQKGVQLWLVVLACSYWDLHRMCLQVNLYLSFIVNVSVKWVGVFGMAVVGLYTIEDLWNKFGDLKMDPVFSVFICVAHNQAEYARHWAARILCLIFLPLIVYMFSFWIHFLILENSGPGDAQMSSLFQANLRGSDLLNSPLEIAIGSKVTIKNAGYGGGLLHSHVQLYPEGSQQQQVTCYHHKDANNDWLVWTNRFEPDFDANSTDIRFLKDGDVIRLIHAHTGRNLHSHSVSAPVTKSENEVSCYGNLTIGDDKDHWIVDVVEDLYSRDRSKIRTLMTTFRLKHQVLGCYLRAGNVNLPQWGFKQIEVTCSKDDNPKDTHTHWNVESHWNEKRISLRDETDIST